MQVTKEMLIKQLDDVRKNIDGFLQGYTQAVSFVIETLDKPEDGKQVQP